MPPPFMETSRILIKEIYLPRPKKAKKGDYGKLLVVGGSLKYTGSATLVALAAYASGCDLVTIAAPQRAADAAAFASPDIITHRLKGDNLKKSHAKEILEIAKWADAVVIGNGLGREKDTLDAVVEIVKKLDKPVLIDADGIKALVPKKHGALSGTNAVITPHAYEMSVFSGEDVEDDIVKRAGLAKRFATDLGVTIVLKGNIDIITSGGKVAINRTGNPYMTKGGTGDTLAGVCGALLARGVDPFSAASAAALINGLAGDLCAKELGDGLTASKMINYIPKAIMAEI